MNYATTANRPNPLAALGALGVPAAVGAVLIAGLAVTQVIRPPISNPVGGNIPDVVEITPEVIETPAPATSSSNSSKSDPVFTTVRPESNFDFKLETTGPVDTGVEIGRVYVPEPVDFVLPTREPVFDPMPPLPRGNPGEWITTNDYRPSWINRGFEGIARFSLAIDANGRVSDCAITGSTGHAQLDRATCELLSKRARFDPAKDLNGDKVAGRYSNSVRWTIPE